jgi:IclR family acetate operon transcriptional repressor
MKPTDRALGVFEAFESAGRPLTLSELAEAAGMPVSTSHGIVQVLLERGYLYLLGHRKELFPTRRLYDMASSIIAHDPYLERLEPYVESLREVTQETVIVGKRQGNEVVYLAVYEGPQTIRYSAAAGARKPLHATSIGKVMLGSLDPVALQTWLDTAALSQVTSETLVTPTALRKEIEKSRRSGYCVTRGESVSDVFAVAVPIEINRDILGIAVAGPQHRMAGRIPFIGEKLLEVKRQIESALS